ncbi:MAG TPA: hypothetical protein VJ549_02115 [Geothrix sp.]|nr:hypothetical protein [Geothrix sp.]
MSHIKLGRLLLASAAILALPLAAQDGSQLNPEFKIRSGLTTGTLAKDLRDNKSFGFALANTFSLGSGKGLSVELGYDVFTGNNRDSMRTTGPVYYNLPGYGVISADSTSGAPLYLLSSSSTDSRSRKMEGFGLRASYVSRIAGIEGLSWQVGLSLDHYKSSSEFLIDLRPVYNDASGRPHTLTSYEPQDPGGNQIYAHEGYAYQAARTTFTFGAHAGLVYQFTKDFKVEGNLRNIGYGVKDYAPLAYTGQPATLSDKNGRGFVFEIGLSMNL